MLQTGLSVPWGLAFLPDGSALLSERDTMTLQHVSSDGHTITTVGVVPGVVPNGEAGLLGLAVPTDYAAHPAVLAYYTAAEDNRVVRLGLSTAGGKLALTGEATPLVTGIRKAGNHDGGRLVVGPDGYLYVGVGDAAVPGAAQDTSSLNGKILRVTMEGKPAPGNPFGTAVYSYGHRNPQGLAFDEAGRLFAVEFGQNTYDEVNLITAGGNYGWPTVEGDGGSGQGFTDPLVTWATGDASPSGDAIAGGSIWVAALRGERLWQVPLDGTGGTGTPVPLFSGDHGRLRTVVRAPDGALWVTTSNRDGRGTPGADDDQLLRVPLA